MKKFLKYFALTLLLLIVVAIVYILATFPPIMTGMAAKTMCSCVFVTNREPASVVEQEFQVFPGMPSLPYEVNREDSSVSVTMFWKTGKAIYRKGLGCTLLAEMDEEAVRAQPVRRPQPAITNQDTIAWPSGNLVKDTLLAGIDYGKVREAVNQAFADVDPKNPVFTHGVAVVYDGHLIAEQYATGYTYNSRMMGWSMTKSITNALIGILVKEGKLKIDEAAPVAEWRNDERSKITLNNLLQASSGLEWSESYFSPTADFHQMFIKSDDKAAYAAARKLKYEPGTFFQYSSGTTNILSRIIRQTVSDSAYYRFPYEKLFHRIGMNTAIIEPDASGTFVASSYSFASARDWARFGLLYLNDGIWNGERILPEGWVKYSTTPAPSAKARQYGAQIWLNLGDPYNPQVVEYPGLPAEAIIFDGFEKNFVVIVPSKKLVVVRLGVTHNKNFSLANLVNGIIAGLPN
ncbi:MAG TPA: serine hydrolase [Ohtaekwangia sp.]|uniref:serine hydrolase domain-containing protein n=1 Tax=Ohtaekwangia sp. TaxID=2066019 RepID=UPI002F955340